MEGEMQGQNGEHGMLLANRFKLISHTALFPQTWSTVTAIIKMLTRQHSLVSVVAEHLSDGGRGYRHGRDGGACSAFHRFADFIEFPLPLSAAIHADFCCWQRFTEGLAVVRTPIQALHRDRSAGWTVWTSRCS